MILMLTECVKWCVDSNIAFEYAGLWIVALAMFTLFAAYFLLRSPALDEKYAWIPELLLILTFLLLAGFMVYEKIDLDRQVSHNIEGLLESDREVVFEHPTDDVRVFDKGVVG